VYSSLKTEYPVPEEMSQEWDVIIGGRRNYETEPEVRKKDVIVVDLKDSKYKMSHEEMKQLIESKCREGRDKVTKQNVKEFASVKQGECSRTAPNFEKEKPVQMKVDIAEDELGPLERSSMHGTLLENDIKGGHANRMLKNASGLVQRVQEIEQHVYGRAKPVSSVSELHTRISDLENLIHKIEKEGPDTFKRSFLDLSASASVDASSMPYSGRGRPKRKISHPVHQQGHDEVQVVRAALADCKQDAELDDRIQQLKNKVLVNKK
jgi:hypothetical protein